MRIVLPFVAAVLLAGLSASAVNAQSSADTEICAADDKAAYSPEQRIAACTTLVEAFKDQPKELADVLVRRGAVYYFVNRMTLPSPISTAPSRSNRRTPAPSASARTRTAPRAGSTVL